MDQNPNNNPPGDVSAPDPNPVASSGDISSSFVPPAAAGPIPDQPLGSVPPPPLTSSPSPSSPPADPINNFGGAAQPPSAWGSNLASNDNLAFSPGFPTQPGVGDVSPPPPLPVEPAVPVNNDSSSGVPGWAVTSSPPSPYSSNSPSLSDSATTGPGDSGGASGFGAADQGSSMSNTGEPMPTFTPPASGSGPSPAAGPDLSGETSFGSIAPEPTTSSFPPTWPPASAAAGSFDMGTSTLGENGSGESGPTDLSHLMTGPVGAETASSPSAPAAATLVSPQPVGPETPAPSQPADTNSGVSQVVTSNSSGGFPKQMLLVGAVVLLIVVAASAYFILGVGKSGEEQQNSLPAEQAPLTNPPRTVLPSPAAQPSQASTSSASFGNLQGAAPQTSTSSGQSGSSALELLRQRQGR